MERERKGTKNGHEIHNDKCIRIRYSLNNKLEDFRELQLEIINTEMVKSG